MCLANIIIVSIDRYVAILHPLVYESRLTYTVIKVMITVAWITAFLLASTFWLWFINADMKSCSIVPGMYQASDTAAYLLTTAVLVFAYGSILRVALQQRAKLAAATELVPPAICSKPTTVLVSTVSSSLNSASAESLHRKPRNSSKPYLSSEQRVVVISSANTTLLSTLA